MRMIDADALIERLEITEKCSECRWADGMCCKKYDMFASACEAIYDAPTINPRKGKWIKLTGMMPPEFAGQYICSNCGELAMRDWKHHRQTLTNFCPNCGAHMVEKGAENENG